MRPLTYEAFVSAQDIARYKRVKWVSMNLARIVREEIVRYLPGAYIGDPFNGSRKQFVVTLKGVFRISTGASSDNSTEQAAHAFMEVESIDFSDEENRREFWKRHGLNPDEIEWQFVENVRSRMKEDGI